MACSKSLKMLFFKQVNMNTTMSHVLNVTCFQQCHMFSRQQCHMFDNNVTCSTTMSHVLDNNVTVRQQCHMFSTTMSHVLDNNVTCSQQQCHMFSTTMKKHRQAPPNASTRYPCQPTLCSPRAVQRSRGPPPSWRAMWSPVACP